MGKRLKDTFLFPPKRKLVMDRGAKGDTFGQKEVVVIGKGEGGRDFFFIFGIRWCSLVVGVVWARF